MKLSFFSPWVPFFLVPTRFVHKHPYIHIFIFCAILYKYIHTRRGRVGGFGFGFGVCVWLRTFQDDDEGADYQEGSNSGFELPGGQ